MTSKSPNSPDDSTALQIGEQASKRVSHAIFDSPVISGFFAGRTTSSYENLKKFAAEQNQVIKAKRAEHENASPFAGYEGVDGLKEALIRQYGNLVKAWQLHFDKLDRGWINYAEFNDACRALGFERSIRKTFRQLEGGHRDDKGVYHGKGNVTLEDLAPEYIDAHEFFKSCLVQRYGSLLEAFRAIESGVGWERRASYAYQKRSSVSSNPHVEGHPVIAERRASNLAATLADFSPENLRKSSSTGSITLPPAAASRTSFSSGASPASTKSLRRSSFSSNLHSGLLDLEDFKKVCKDVKFHGDAVKLFSWLDADQCGTISVEEIDPTVALTLWKGGAELSLMEAGISTSRNDPNKMNRMGSAMDGAPTLASLRYKIMRVERRKKVEEAERLAKLQDISAKDVEGFRKLLVHRHRSIVNAWKCCLDKGLSGRISWFDFCKSCRELGYGGSVRRLFGELDSSNKGFVSLYDIDDRAAKAIEGLASLVAFEWGTVRGAWEGTFNPRGKARISLAEFTAGCKKMNYKGNPALVLDALDCSRHGTLSFEDFSFLQMWFALPEIQFYQGKNQMGHVARFRWNQGREQRERLERESEDINLEEFVEMLGKRFGNYVRAWRKALDLDGNGRITYNEFCLACRLMGVPGSVKKLWKELDENGSGSISIDEIDPATGEMLQDFASKVTKQCPSWDDAWNLIFDPPGAMKISKSQFAEGCDTLGFDGNRDKLFRLLDIDHSHYLTLDKMNWITKAEAKKKDEDKDEDDEDDEERIAQRRKTFNANTKASEARRLTMAHERMARDHETVASPGMVHSRKSTVAAKNLFMLTEMFGAAGKRGSTMEFVQNQVGSGRLNKEEIRKIEANCQKKLVVALQNKDTIPTLDIAWGDGWDPECVFMEDEEEDY